MHVLEQTSTKMKTLSSILNPIYEQVQHHPAFLEKILQLIDTNTKNVYIERKFKRSAHKLPGSLVIVVKDFHNMRRYDIAPSRQTGKQGQYGTTSADKGNNLGQISLLPLKEHTLDFISDRELHKQSVLEGLQLYSPFDWTAIGDDLYIATEKEITIISQKTGIQTISHPLLSWPHSITPINRKDLLISSSGTDFILILDTVSKKIIKEISAWEYGWQTSLGIADVDGSPIKRINAFTDTPLDDYHKSLRDNYGFEVHYYNRQNFHSTSILTRNQSVHFNSAIQHPAGFLIATSFATSRFDIASGKRITLPGTGGTIFAIDEEGMHPIIEGLTNPHHVIQIGEKDNYNFFMVTNTGAGAVHIYKEQKMRPMKWEFVGKLDFSNLPERNFRISPWLQQAIPTIGDDGNFYISACDNSRRGIYILDLNNQTYHFIRTSDEAVVHRVSYVNSRE
jgi:hypothetical protein